MTALLRIVSLRQAYQAGTLTPASLFADLRERAAALSSFGVFIHLLDADEIQPWLDQLNDRDPAIHPLWGIPFAIKDNIDLAQIPTTAGCEAYRYTPEHSATVVQNLIDAGAIPLGKANLDQFATGLNGTRSPFGPCHNAFDADFVSGGSSAGSAVAVALGLACFSLGTDTAGSGRVPAGFNNLVGAKPTRGLLSKVGVVPACRSLDCVSVFAHSVAEANTVLAAAEGHDAADPWSRRNPAHNQHSTFGQRSGFLRLGVLDDASLKFFGHSDYEAAYRRTLAILSTDPAITLVPIDYQPFDQAARLLYEGPWVTERYLAIQNMIDTQPDALLPVIRDIIGPGKHPKATALFSAQYQLKALRGQCDAQMASIDALLTPSAGAVFTIDQMLANPIVHNAELGYYTNFMNLLDYAAVAIPTTFTGQGLPFGVTLAGPAFHDRELLSIGQRLEPLFASDTRARSPSACLWEALSDNTTQPAPTTGRHHVELLVCGAHMSGLPLNGQLLQRAAQLVGTARTAPGYQLFALPGTPPRPALVRAGTAKAPENSAVDGASSRRGATDSAAGIDAELWSLPVTELGSLLADIPAPLGLGKVRLNDNRWVTGFIAEACAAGEGEDITAWGGWRAWLANREVASGPSTSGSTT